LRLPHHDYASPGAYFVTVCTHERRCLFGDIRDDAMHPNEMGQTIEACWRDLPHHYVNVALDTFVVMPNHVHGIVTIKTPRESVSSHGLMQIVRSFKAFSARRIGVVPLWQRGYYEHVIRSDESLAKIREYIASNPIRWALDRENPANVDLVAKGARLRRAPTE
jgi:REP element-mobilizing transposase RayT